MQHLTDIMSIQTKSYKTKSMRNYIKSRIKKLKLKYEQDNYGNIYVTKGDIDRYPTMVCHIDTVHDINKNVHVMRYNDIMFAMDMQKVEQYGIGGDDKVGIYITLQLLESFDYFKAVFFLDEEVGCVGSSKANFDFFNDSTIVLQCDRRGYNDFVNTISGTQLFDDTLQYDIQDILTQYGRNVVSGGMTDVESIAEKTNVQVANMSCGYYNPHSNEEYIKISEVHKTLYMCNEILLRTSNKLYRIENRINHNHYSWAGNYGTSQYWSYNNGYGTAYYDTDVSYEPEICPHCGVNDAYYDEWDDLWYCMSCEMETTNYQMQEIKNTESKQIKLYEN